MAHIYNFAIIRVSPDPRRGELVNIGIVVFLPSKLDIHLLPSLTKVHALHGELDLTQLYDLPAKMNAFMPKRAPTSDRHRLIRQLGMVELSELGQFQAEKEQYDVIVEKLMTKLVKPTVGAREVVFDSSGLVSQVRKVLKDVKLLGRRPDDIEKHKIVPNFAVDAEKGLYADFAGKNSIHHFTETIDFRVARGINGPKFNEFAKATLVLREAKNLFTSSNRTVIYAIPKDF